MSCVVTILVTGNSRLCEGGFAMEVPLWAVVVVQVGAVVVVEAVVEGE